MKTGRDERALLRERIRRIITMQRSLNEQLYRFSQSTQDLEVQRVLSEAMSRGNENIQELARLLAAKCNTCR